MDDIQFCELLNRFNRSWPGYRKVRKGVKKRIGRHLRRKGFSSIDDFLDATKKNIALQKELELLLLVPITRFFRDRGLWRALENRILPGQAAHSGKKLKVWSAGCSNGDEAYSVKITWHQIKRAHSDFPDLEILGTDANPECIENARRGIYRQSSLKEVPAETRTRYFKRRGTKNRWEVKEFLKEGIQWKVAELPDDLPPKAFDVLFLRNNILTYYLDPLRSKIFKGVLTCLAPTGILIVGSHENLPPGFDELTPDRHIPCVYHRNSAC